MNRKENINVGRTECLGRQRRPRRKKLRSVVLWRSSKEFRSSFQTSSYLPIFVWITHQVVTCLCLGSFPLLFIRGFRSDPIRAVAQLLKYSLAFLEGSEPNTHTHRGSVAQMSHSALLLIFKGLRAESFHKDNTG